MSGDVTQAGPEIVGTAGRAFRDIAKSASKMGSGMASGSAGGDVPSKEGTSTNASDNTQPGSEPGSRNSDLHALNDASQQSTPDTGQAITGGDQSQNVYPRDLYAGTTVQLQGHVSQLEQRSNNADTGNDGSDSRSNGVDGPSISAELNRDNRDPAAADLQSVPKEVLKDEAAEVITPNSTQLSAGMEHTKGAFTSDIRGLNVEYNQSEQITADKLQEQIDNTPSQPTSNISFISNYEGTRETWQGQLYGSKAA